jgi:hypothetical protein
MWPVSGILAGNSVDSTFSRNIISLNLASPFDPNFPRYRLGYTHIVAPKWSQSIDFGYGNSGILPDSSFFTNKVMAKDYRLWEIRMEARFYYLGIRKYVTPYAAIEFYYIHHTQTMYHDDYMPAIDTFAVHYEQADFLRQKYGINGKAGIIIKVSPHIAAEFYAGIGIRARKNSYVNVINPSYGTYWFEDYNYYYYEGTRWNFNATFGLKLNFMF